MDRRMAKKRVSDIAQENNLPPKEVIEKLQKAGLSVKAAGSAVDENEAKRILGVNGGGSTRPARRRAVDPVVPGRQQPAPRGGNAQGRGGRGPQGGGPQRGPQGGGQQRGGNAGGPPARGPQRPAAGQNGPQARG